MSVLLAAVTAITSTPLPTPSPQVVTQLQPIINQVPVVPAQVLQLAQTLALAGAVAFVSVVHQLIERGKLSGNANRLIVAGYTLAASLGTAALTGHLGTSAADLQVEITSFLVALGAALGRYEYLWKLLLNIFQGVLPKQTTTPLATDEPVESAV